MRRFVDAAMLAENDQAIVRLFRWLR